MPGAEGAGPCPQGKALRAAERDRGDPPVGLRPPEGGLEAEARRGWRAGLARVEPRRLVFLDETGIDTRTTRAFARAARGERATGEVPRGRRERLAVPGALAPDGVVASRSIAAATGTAVFLAFVEQAPVPAPRDRPDAVVVTDNLAAHEAAAVRHAFGAAGTAYRHPPACSPELVRGFACRAPTIAVPPVTAARRRAAGRW